MLVGHLLKSKKGYKYLKKQEIQDIWFMYIFRICLEEQLLINYLLHNKAFNIPKYPSCQRYLRGLASMVYNFFS